MHAEIILIDYSSDGHLVECFVHLFVYFNVKFLEALISEGKELSHGPALMVPSQQGHLPRVVNLYQLM